MNCIFCNKPCFDLGENSQADENWQCAGHTTRAIVQHCIRYLYHKEGECTSEDCCPTKTHEVTIIRWTHKNDKYAVRLNHFADKLEVIKMVSKGMIVSQLVLQLNFIPDLTPENLDQKLPLWITFS